MGTMSNAVWLFWQFFFLQVVTSYKTLATDGTHLLPSRVCARSNLCAEEKSTIGADWYYLLTAWVTIQASQTVPACESEHDLPSSRHFTLCQKSVLMSWFSKNKVLYCHLSETCHDKYINLRCLWGEQCPSEVRQPCAMPTQLYIVARMTSLNQALMPLNVFSQMSCLHLSS